MVSQIEPFGLPFHLHVPAEQRICSDCNVPMTEVHARATDTWELIPARIVLHRRLDQTLDTEEMARWLRLL